jgi:hypothetical protein
MTRKCAAVPVRICVLADICAGGSARFSFIGIRFTVHARAGDFITHTEEWSDAPRIGKQPRDCTIQRTSRMQIKTPAHVPPSPQISTGIGGGIRPAEDGQDSHRAPVYGHSDAPSRAQVAAFRAHDA